MSKKLYTRTLTLPNGKRKYVRAATEKEADRKLLELQLALHQGVDISDNTTFTELAQLWFNAFKKGQLHPRSVEIIKGTLNRYILPCLGHLKVREIKPLHVQLMMKSVSHLSKSTQSKVLNYTKAIFHMAVDNGIILRSPVTSAIKVNAPTPEQEDPLTPDQELALVTATKGTRAYDFIVIALFGGLRKGEALGLMWTDFDYEAGVVHVNRNIVFTEENRAGIVDTEMKTEAAHRTVPLPQDVLAYFQERAKLSGSEYVLSMEDGSHLTEGGFRNMWEGVRRRSALGSPNSPIEKRFDFTVHPHQLRHTCITRWFEAGLDLKEVQRMAGHATPDMTLRVYTHYDEVTRAKETASKVRSTARVALAAI